MSTNNIGVEKLYEITFHIAHPDSHLASSANPIHFVQRLDYSTSGVLCIARNKAAAARAGKLFENRLTRKYYLAVVRGHVDFEMGDIEYEVGESLTLVLPDPQEPLDIQTPDCFFSESTFSEKWKSETCLYKYRSKEEFLNVCDIIDKFNVIGVRYKMFKYSEE
ncbi:putative ribosomal large subunit pseudouridine synthase a [Operophtera brumata]|uniref:Putative ribosomal large subunit pseudouridine synthase a n=1 Tax=Operophtera brumata TaxID=104452 RepID=A0A0L7KTU5_OPEBR|nr:putative ribosomal large subunit pseudouridine synthase a [Operophtera brumata]